VLAEKQGVKGMAEDKFNIAGMDIGFNHALACILPSGEIPVGQQYAVVYFERLANDQYRYLTKDEDTGKEEELTKEEVWDEYYHQLMLAISHDVIPAFCELLTRDGWEVPDDNEVWSIAEESISEYESYIEWEFLPKTHEDWLCVMLEQWALSRGWDRVIPFDETDFAGLPIHISRRIEQLNQFSNDLSTDELETIVRTLVTFVPYLEDKSSVIKALTNHNALISELIQETVENLESELEGTDDVYLSKLSEFVKQIDETLG
jgi:hypothetical protein